ncbi:MAG: 50S ribosomal protein L11 methyltransferase [Clostridia bacterium]|nr:50S ribosomal protein L11 methyltransferase [Clostridia bacterium]
MKYIEVKIHVNRDGIEPVSSLLMEKGIEDIVVQDPRDVEELVSDSESYRWDYIDESVLKLQDEEPVISFYLENDRKSAELLEHIRIDIFKLKNDFLDGTFGTTVDFGPLEIEAEVVDDGQWKDNWKQYFKPSRLTERLVVKPTWEDYEADENDLVIELDPGMAFGTGTHETTSLCLKLLEKYGAKGKKILDAGSGSGILSIAAVLLGAKEAVGVDIDPTAVEVGRENVEQNGLSSKIRIVEGDLTKGIGYKADVILANIMADIVKLITPDVPAHLEKGGIYISSGILVERRDDVVMTIRESGFRILETVEDGEWCAIVAAYGKAGEN